MSKDQNAWQQNANQLGRLAVERFAVRTDACGLYVKSNVPPFDYSPGPNNTTAKLSSLEELRGKLNKHFRGIQIAGLHSQTADSRCRWFGIDLDCKEWYPEREERAARNLAYAQTLQDRLRERGFFTLLEDSNGIGGYHVLGRFDELVPQAWLYHFLQSEIIHDAEDCGFGTFVDADGKKQSDLPETFPKQADCEGKFGNWLRLPGRHHRLTDHWSQFIVDGEILSIADSVQAWIEFPASDHRLIPEFVAPTIPKPAPKKITATSTTGVKGCRESAQDHVESMPWPELLTAFHWQDCGGGMWRRPGKPAGGHSAQLNDVGLHVYSEAVADLEAGETYGKWRFYVCSSGFTMDGAGQIEAARHLFGQEQADAIDKEAQRAFAKQHGDSQPAVNLTGILSSGELTKEVDEVWIVFTAVDEAELQAAGAVVVRAPAAGKESFTDWSTLSWRKIHIIDGGHAAQAANIYSLLSHYAKESTVEIHPLNSSGEASTTLSGWFPENCPDGDRLQAIRNIQFPRGEYATKSVDEIEIEQGLKQKPNGKNLVFHDAWKAANKPRPMRQCIIEGILRRGEVGNIIAATKIGKSWFALMLMICIATGRDWLGRRVARGNVLLIDNELHEETLENRISAVQFAMRIPPEAPRDRFEYVACRGNWISIQDLMEALPSRYPPGSLNLICIDAKYRLFGNGLEENSNDDQTTFHNMIDQFAAVMNCPIVLVHHATKGDQGSKAVTDVGSGGGSQARTVDLHMVIRPHQQPDLSVLDAGVRSFTKFEPMTLRWNWPLWSVAEDVEPALQADKSRGDSRQEAKDNAGVEDLRKILEGSECPLSRNALHKAFGGGKERLNRLIRIGLEKGVFEAAGTKKAQNGEVAELFTLATNQGSDVQRSELNGPTVCSGFNPDRSDGP